MFISQRFTFRLQLARYLQRICVDLPKEGQQIHFLFSNIIANEQTHTPVVALLAELLLEVTQGETVALHGPPVGDLLTTEEICHHCLTTGHPVVSYTLFILLHPESRQRGREMVC